MTPRSCLLLFFALAACAPVPAPSLGPAVASLEPTGRAERVILLSFDGLGADALARQEGLPSFEWLIRNGFSARVIPVNPTVTSSTHVSILTGADPQRTGIVSNRLHLHGSAPGVAVRGMLTEIDVETIVEAARRQGRRVGSVSFPAVDNGSPRRSADFGFAWTEPLNQASIVELGPADFRREWVPPTWSARPSARASYSPVMRARIEWSATPALRADIDVVAYDTTNDGIVNYDTYTLERYGRELEIDDAGWVEISLQTTTGLHGSWSKVLATSTAAPGITMYWGAIHRTNAWPATFQTRLDASAGFWPGAPEEHLPIDPETFLQQMERLARFYTAAQTMALRELDFDLLLLYHPQIDEVAHAFLGTVDGERYLRRAWAISDHALGSILPLLDRQRDALVITGDHGLVAAEREIRMNRFLADHGFAPQWHAITSGSLAHLYRFSEPDNGAALHELLLQSGHFERVERKSADHHRNSGDLIATAWPTIALSESADAPVVVRPSRAGHHGGLSHHRELHPALVAWGAGIPAGKGADVPQTRIARFVAALLGIEPPAAAE